MLIKKLTIAVALLAAGVAHAVTAPATTVTGYTSFSGTTVGSNTVNVNSVLYGFEEQTLAIDTSVVYKKNGVAVDHYTLNGDTVSKKTYDALSAYDGQTVKSFFIFYDPAKQGSIDGTVTFQNTILGVVDTRAGLLATQIFQKSGITYNLTASANGLEATDGLGYGGNELKLDWKASNPGDYIRVLTAVPEPETYAMFLAGLGIMGAVVRRRKNAA